MTQTHSKSDALYVKMRHDILTLSLAPDSPLRLPAMAERYGIGATPIRECLHRLSTEKLVVIEHNRGFRVSSISLSELFDLEHSRSAIEGMLFQRAVENGDDAWEAGLIGAYHQLSRTHPMSVTGTQGDIDLWNRRHSAFHDALIAAAGAPWMQHFQQQLKDQLGRYQLFIQNGLRDLFESHPENAPHVADIYAKAMATDPHDDLYQVALARDVAAARPVFEQHVNLSIRAFQELSALIPAGAVVATTLGSTSQEARA